MTDLYCLHCGADKAENELSDEGVCSECATHDLQVSAADYFDTGVDPNACVHCGCYWNNREDCCGCGANLNDASR